MIPRCLLCVLVLIALSLPVQSFVLHRCVHNAMSASRVSRLHAFPKHKPDLTSASGVEVTHDEVFARDVLSTRKPSTFFRVCALCALSLQWRR